MDDTTLWYDAVARAEAHVTQQKADLEAECAKARVSRSRDDWLAARSDLLRLEHLIRDHPHRQSRMSNAHHAYQGAYLQRLAEMEQDCPFQIPAELAGPLNLYRWLAHALRGATDADLMALLSDVRLHDADKAKIANRIEANRTRWVPIYTLFSRASGRPATVAGGTDAEWAQYVQSVTETLHIRERELDGQMRAHEMALRSDVERELHSLKQGVKDAETALLEAETALARRPEIDAYVACRIETFVAEQTREKRAAYEAALGAAEEIRRECISEFQRRLELGFSNTRVEDFAPPGDHALRRLLEEIRDNHVKDAREAEEREWWVQALTHPIDEVIDKLCRVPRDHTDAALDLLLNMPADTPHLHDKRVHDFLRREHSNLARHPAGTTAVLVAHAGFLIAQGDHEAARELLNRLPAATQSTIGAVTAYLCFVLSKPTELSGATEFDTLAPEDLFLAACYYDSDKPGPALDTLRKQSEWGYKRLSEALSASGGRELSDFQVRGLQPRIAELAFRSVYPRLCHRGSRPSLHDLNLEVIKAVRRPWRLTSKPVLPSADWEATGGREYDVKCNLFYRTKTNQEKFGLRGFFIKRSSGLRSFSAFLFTGSDTRSCMWTYLGEYHPSVTSKSADDRVLPFLFRLPDSERFALSIPSCEPALGRRLLCNHRLRLGWQLATGTRLPQNQWPKNDAERLLYTFIDTCVRIAADTFLEHALWRALTESTLEACGEHARVTVEAFLDRAFSLIADCALPVHLPRIDGRPLLCRWVAEVLRPLVENWHRIRWTACGRCGDRAGTPRLQITRMTSEGTIYGRMICEGCGVELEGEVTVLAHCHKCGHYPLIIGRNPTCTRCHGLVCEYTEGGSSRCKCCKKGCSHGQHTPDADFMEGTEEQDWSD